MQEINRVAYVGKDLEAMSFAINYHKWILDEFRPFIGKRVVEVGAGTGAFSELLLAERPEQLTLVEPSEMFRSLNDKFRDTDQSVRITLHNSLFADVRGQISESGPDSIFYVNVLEHIEDDETELVMIREALAPGGRCLIFVPALRWLYGPFDRNVGHFRRYSKDELASKCRRAGLRVLKVKYFDALGVVPWWIRYRLLQSDSLDPRSVAAYDRFVVPTMRRIESRVVPFIGKNLLVVAAKDA